MLAPGTGKTSTGRLLGYLRDGRLYAGLRLLRRVSTKTLIDGRTRRTHLAVCAECCGPTATRGSAASTRAEVSSRRPVGPMRAGNTVISMPPAREALKRITALYAVEAIHRRQAALSERVGAPGHARPLLDASKEGSRQHG